MVTVAGEEHDPRDIVLGNKVEQFFLFGRELSEGFKQDERVDHLPAACDDFECFIAVDEGLFEPLELAFPEHSFCRATGVVVWSAMVAVIQHKEFDVAPLEPGENAFGFGGAVNDLWPILFVELKANVFEAEAGIGVVWAVIVVVPGGVVVGRREEGLDAGVSAVGSPPVAHGLFGQPVHFSVVEVVSEPEHKIRSGFVEGIKDFIVTAVGSSWSVESGAGLVEISARSETDFELWGERGIGCPAPVGLGLEFEGVASLNFLIIDR